MGKLKTERIIIKDRSRYGDDIKLLDFKIDINVVTDGSFTATLPEEIVDKLEQALIEVKTNGRRNARKGFFSDSTLDGLMNQITSICDEYASKDLIKEDLIIRYVIETGCSYVKDEEGNFFPNGGFTDEDLRKKQGKNGWVEGTLSTDATHPEPFGFRVWTQVCLKRVYRYKSGEEKTEFEPLWAPSLETCYGLENVHWLANIVSIKPPTGEVKEINCTEDTALFFVNIYKVIFKINEGIKAFATDAMMIEKFIEQKQKLLF